jgi:ferredoxin-NADP reductase
VQRELLTARLEHSSVLSERTQCFHLEFAVEGVDHFSFVPGQFVSLVAEDAKGKQQTRAYSIASAPDRNRFDLCLNRVEGGFFSNRLADMKIGDELHFHGPHGLFTLREPLTDAVFVATGTGIAPMRGFVEYLFPENGENRSQGKHFWLVYGTRHEGELYYSKYFERIAAERENFHYLTTLSRPHDGWEGLRGYVQEHVAEIATQYAQTHEKPENAFGIHAYICGLNEMVSANRERLKSLDWERKQIVFERYD